MEYHYIDPDSDHMLQSGMAEDSAGKLQAISGILCDEEALKAIRRIFDPDEWERILLTACAVFTSEGRNFPAFSA